MTKILVIDDDTDVCDTVKVILTNAGLRVICAEEGNAGIQLYQKHAVEIGLVLLDWSMPGLSGEVTFHELRAINANLKIILSSGFAESEATRRLMGKGLTGYMQKPYLADVLVKEIRSLGINIELSSPKVARCVDEVGIGFLYAPLLHTAMKHVMAARREMGVRTVFNMLGPLTNPAGANAQVIGVYAAALTELLGMDTAAVDAAVRDWIQSEFAGRLPRPAELED